MPVSLLLVTYLLIASLALFTLAFILYRQNRPGSELRWDALLLFSLGAACLALAALLWMGIRLAEKTPAQAPVSTSAQSATRSSGEEP